MNIQCVFVVTFAAPGTFSQAATFALQNAFFWSFRVLGLIVSCVHGRYGLWTARHNQQQLVPV